MKTEYKKEIQIDTLKLVTEIKYFSEPNKNLFKSKLNESTGEIESKEFNAKWWSDYPFALYIHMNALSGKLTMEFSSKLLLDDYPQLITIDTLPLCLHNIVKYGICKLDIESIIKNHYCSKIHITKDINMQLTPEILNTMNMHVENYRRYSWQRYENNAILFKKNVETRGAQEEIIVYNKEKEISLPKNKAFLAKLSNPEVVLEYFKGKTRFEMKYEGKKKIKKGLKIENTSLQDIMQAEQNPLLNQFDKIFTAEKKDVVPDFLINNIITYGQFNILRFHNGNLKKIEQEMKDMGLYKNSSRGAMGKQMKKMSHLLHSLNNQSMNADDIIEGIRQKLKN